MDRAEKTREMFETLLPDPPEIGVNPGWIRLVPYQSEVSSGQKLILELEVRNYHDHPIAVEAELVIHRGWSCSPETGRMGVEPGEAGRIPFTVSVGTRRDRFGIAADITLDSRHLGQIAEAIIKVK